MQADLSLCCSNLVDKKDAPKESFDSMVNDANFQIIISIIFFSWSEFDQ